MPHDMIDEYFEIYTNSVKEYGEKTCVFYACGSFYEVYRVDNDQEQIGNADVIAEIIRCDFSNKNKSKRAETGSTRAFPDFCGFGIPYLPKYLAPLLENNYTVVIVDQLEASTEKRGKLVKRGVVAVHSPCLKSPDLETYQDGETYLVNLLIELVIPKSNVNINNTMFYSLCSINNTTNAIDITENAIEFRPSDLRIALDDIHLSKYNTRELRINIVIDNKQDYTHYIKTIQKYFDEQSQYNNYTYKIETISTECTKYTEYSKKAYQEEYFRRVYKHLNFGLIEPTEFLCLSGKQCSIINFMFLLDFIAKHDLNYINNLSIPTVRIINNNLVLELNTLHQLNILPSKNITTHKFSSVFDVINFTNTTIGKRYLRSLLVNPFRDVDTINSRYLLSDELIKMDSDHLKNIERELSTTIDFDRLHRKMGLDALHPYEFDKLNTSYIKITKIFDLLSDTVYIKDLIPNTVILQKFSDYISDYKKSFDLDQMRRIGFNTTREDFINFFNSGVITELDKISNDIQTIEKDIESIRLNYDKILNDDAKSKTSNTMVKLASTDTEGYFFTCTKIRYQKLANHCKDTVFTTRQTSNICKFTTSELTRLSDKLTNTRDLLVKRVKMHYILKLQNYYQEYNNVFTSLTHFVEILDVSLSNVRCAQKYRYCKPVVDNSDQSYVIAESLRHPIIELINNETEYIPNDIHLNERDGITGMLVYGLNSSGKSSLLRSIGVSVILAQCGLYVPCKKFSFSPFHTVISQVDLSDNLFANKSSFTSEMCGLQKILECSGKNTLVLSDELCRGTEVNSSSAIVVTTLLHLIKTHTVFFFTTHLHDLPNIPEIASENKIKIAHLSVETRDDTIIFERRLQPGSGSDLYGLEVCKSIIRNQQFIDLAFRVRNEIVSNGTKIIEQKRSRYNKKKITDHCEVCGYKPKRGQIPLDTHHINEQKDCDEMGFVNDKHFHKNKTYNLVSLCKSCHQKIDTGELIIRGYKSSTSGVFLDYSNV
jgi:DNA mismatch repair protein MutS